ncbi:cytoskeleton-associated protein 5-like [Tropilaelaps mercedesae]|uniref:Cytoskeleton-associated protein 5-like n=1 Tax=Tropilaelaps mercedesae TaxID=418985 RepID=A0A1V9XB46_9ACAR|nr:cytoskeleton-associated protein 5-like [Tropilaelaps mercedesae]
MHSYIFPLCLNGKRVSTNLGYFAFCMDLIFQEQLEDVSHLPLVQRMQHKQMGNKEKGWTDCAALLRELPEGDPQFKEYAPLIKKTLKEKSPKSIILALTCLEPLVRGYTLEEAEYADLFGHMCANILNHANKNIASQCRDVFNVCIEREQHDALVDACVKAATSSKTPKVHEVNLAFLVAILKDYGPGVINLRKVKPVLTLVTSANGNVRNECRNLIMEMYRWAKDDIKPLLKDLPEKNLPKESEFEALKDETPEPLKFTQAVQEARKKAVDSAEDPATVVPLTPLIGCLADPIDILKKIPGLMKLLADKTELKGTLPTLRDMLEQNPLLVPNLNYDELIKVLLNIAVNEAKFMLSVDSCKSLAQLALKVPNSMAAHSSKAIPELVKRAGFRQKALVDACNKAVDAMVPTMKFDKFLDLMVELVEDKKPDIVMEAGELIARAVPRCPENERPKKLPGGLVNALGKAFACSKPEARDAAMKATGALLKLTNDKALQAQVEKLDNPKKNKVNDFKDKCELFGASRQLDGGRNAPNGKDVKSAMPSKKVPKVPSKEGIDSDASEQRESSGPPPARKPLSNASSKIAGRSVAKAGVGGGTAGGKKKVAAALPKGSGKVMFTENVLSDEDLFTQVESVAGEAIRSQLADSNWKIRLTACEELKTNVTGLDHGSIPVQAITRIVTKKPGLKDSNFQVLKIKIEVLADIFTRGRVSLHTLDACKSDLTEKLGDLKNSAIASQALMSLAEATSLDLVSTQVLEAAFAQKSPKVQSEALNWTGQAIKEFGFKVPAKSVIETMKSALSASNPAVRTAAVKLFGVMYMYLKAPLRGFFESEKPAVLALLDQEIAAVQEQTPPAPFRGVKPLTGDDTANGKDTVPEEMTEEVDAADLLPRTDISTKLQGAIITEMCDSNWKVRLEALNKVQAIVGEANAITPDLGELPKALKARIGDTNKNLATIAMKLCQSLIEAMGPNGHKHSHVLLPAVMAALADSKVQVRLTAIACLNKWYEVCRDPLNMFLDGDKISDAFKSENPYLRSDLLDWFSSKLSGHKGKLNKEFLNTCINPIFSCLEDRNGEVRKKAQACLLPFGKHTGYNVLQARCNALPPSSKGSIGKQLEAIKGELAKSGVTSPHTAATSLSSTKTQSEKKTLVALGNTTAFTRKPSNLTKATRDFESEPEETSPSREEKRAGSKKGEEEMNPAVLFASRDLRQPATRRDPMMRWYIHDTKTLEKEKQELLGELKRMFEAAGASYQCIQLSFSEMLPHHQKVTDIWIQALRDEITQDMMLANRDLIIRWGAVHCYDKNWMTINHFMRFLLELFPIMNDRGIYLETVEVNILLPNFLSKFVSMTAQSQELVDNVMRALPLVCKPSQIFLNVADMLKNQKNFKLAKNMIDELNKLMEEHRDEIRRLPNLRIVVKALSDLTKQANMKELSLRTISELCYLKEGHKDQRDMMREISDKDRVSVEKYMTKIREERPPPAPIREVREAVTEPSSPARHLARPSAAGNSSGSVGNRTIVRTSCIGRGIPSPRGSLQFSPRTPPHHLQQQQQQMEHLNAVNNNTPMNHHNVHLEGHGPPSAQASGLADPCGTFVRTSGNNRSPLGLSRTIRQPSAPIVRHTYDAENFERISRLADLALRKEEQTRLSGGPMTNLPPTIPLASNGGTGGVGVVGSVGMGGLDEHAIARKLNCTAVEDVILAGQQILMSLQSGEVDAVLPGVTEAYVNSLFANVGQQWNTVLTLYIPDDTSKEEDIRQVIQTLGACVYIVITTGSYAKFASQMAIESLLPPAFQLLSHEFLEKFLKTGSTTSDVQKRLNDIIVKSLDKCNATRVTCALLRIYTDRVARKLHETDRNARTCLDLMTKCLWKLVRHWKQHLPDDLEVLPVLRTGDQCLTAFAAMPVHTCDIDKELRTVKSVITELYSHHENKVLEQTRANFDPESEVYRTVMRAKRNRERSFKQEKDRTRLKQLMVKFQETGDLEEVVIHVLVEDIPQEEVLRLCTSPDQQESIKAVFRELPNIAKSIESKGFPENFGYLSSEAVTEIMKYLEKLWDLPGMTPANMPQIIDDARNRACPDISAEIKHHTEYAQRLLAELTER